MPKKVLQCECFTPISYSNMARHRAHCPIGKRLRVLPTKECAFCGKKQTKMVRHIRQTCTGSRFDENYTFFDSYGSKIIGRGPWLRQILKKMRCFQHLRIGGENSQGKTACVTHLLAKIPHTVIDGAGNENIAKLTEQIRNAPQKIVVVEMYEMPKTVLDVPGKKIITISDKQKMTDYYQIIFTRLRGHSIGNLGHYRIRQEFDFV